MRSTFSTLLALSLLAAPVGAQTHTPQDRGRAVVREAAAPRPAGYQRGAHEQTDRVTHTLKIGANGELDLFNLAGPTTVTRGSGNEAIIEIVKTARGASPEDAREMLRFVTVSVLGRGSRAEIKTQYPAQRRLHVTVAYTVSAPANTRLTVRSLSGSIKVTDIHGDLSLETTSGNVDVSGASRIAGAKSVSGNVTITGMTSDAGMEASSISGNVTLRDVQARRLSLSSVSGNVVMENVACERAEAQSMSGNVFYTGTLAQSGRYDMKSHSGDVRLRVDGRVGFELDASTFSGSIKSDLPLTTRGGQTMNGPGRRAFRGAYGDGSALINIVSFSGSVLIGTR
ncbi:MAG: DUF4097 family beta strand repeat protein [Acidobacteria bacterium]|nr:DUF4097 family beta strand repeat protein [Acidobacteriota bacterium]